MNGKPLAITSPRDALDAGIAYLTEDRKTLGLFMSTDRMIGRQFEKGLTPMKIAATAVARW